MRCKMCFQDIDQSYVCPFCGFDNHTEVREPYFLHPGEILCERYAIGQAVGAGGFGVTYAAWDTLLRRRVAIKEYLPGEFSTRLPGASKVTVYGGEKEEQFEGGLEKFYEESMRLARFREVPGIVQIYDCFRENGTAYIVMEFLEGETLGERLKRDAKISVNEAIEIILPVLDALEAVHKEGIIHRDIAPNNIFLCKDGGVKLLDFGAARSATGTHSKSLTVLYKEGYTAEEQYRSRGEQGPWTDVYAVAATLYKAVTGNIPDGAMERRRKDRLKPPGKCGVKIPLNAERAIMNALNMDVKKRTRSAGELKKELLSVKTVGNRFRRTKEGKIGKIPKGVWVLFACLFLAGMIPTGLLYTGVIEFHMEQFSNFFVEDGKAMVMNLVNMEEEEARERLEGIGLGLEIVEVKYSNKVQEGRIISQEEEKGGIVDAGTVIHVVVSKGAGIVEVPDMLHQEWATMKEVLDELCLEYELEETAAEEVPGYVTEQFPLAGTSMEQGQTVKVIVSSGMGYDKSRISIMENYLGKTYEEMRESAAEKGFYLLKRGERYDDAVPQGCIVQQSVAEGGEIRGEDVVEVYVSLGLEPREVPEMVGKMQDEAAEMLEDLDLVPVYTQEINNDVEEGIVLSQNIQGGSRVDKFSEIVLTVSYHGVEVPDFTGMLQEEIMDLCREKGLICQFTEVLSGNGTAKQQTPGAGTFAEPGDNVSIEIGISEEEFSRKVVEMINTKRQAQGLQSVTLSGSWSDYAKTLADTGRKSADSLNGYDFSWVIGGSYRYVFWATRDNVKTVSQAESKLPFTESACLNSDVDTIGIAYYGSRIVLLIADT